MLSSGIFCLCGFLCGGICQKYRARCHNLSQNNVVIIMATLTSNETVQIPSPQTKRPKPPRPPSPIYEYVSSTIPSVEMKEQDVEIIDSESEELGSDTQLGFEASKITDSEHAGS